MPAEFVGHAPFRRVHVEARYGGLEIARIGHAVGAERTEFGELIVRAEDFLHVASGGAVGEGDAESYAGLDDDEFARADHESAHFGLDVKEADLGKDEEVTVAVAEGGSLHGGVGGVDVDGEAFF